MISIWLVVSSLPTRISPHLPAAAVSCRLLLFAAEAFELIFPMRRRRKYGHAVWYVREKTKETFYILTKKDDCERFSPNSVPPNKKPGNVPSPFFVRFRFDYRFNFITPDRKLHILYRDLYDPSIYEFYVDEVVLKALKL